MLLTVSILPNNYHTIPFPKHSGSNRVELKIHTLKARNNSIAIFASFLAMYVSRKQFLHYKEAAANKGDQTENFP